MANRSRGKRFEDLLRQVEEIVQQLEGGELPLEESMDRYQEGIKALKACYSILEETQKKIEIVLGENADGSLQTAPFAESSPEGSPPVEGSMSKDGKVDAAKRSDELF